MKGYRWKRNSILVRIGSFFQRWIRYRAKYPPVGRSCQVRVIAGTANQRAALTPVVESLVSRGIDVQFHHAFNEVDGDWGALNSQAQVWCLLLIPSMIWRMLTASVEHWRTMKWGFDQQWLSLGYYVAFQRWLAKYPCQIFLVSNDHSCFSRTAAIAAGDLGVTTMYMQHASVTPFFPPLSFDLATLDGENALNSYLQAGPTNTEIYLAGMAKFDHFASRVHALSPVRRVGVAVNMLDPQERIIQVLEELAKIDLLEHVTLRPHPRTGLQVMAALRADCDRLGFGFSHPAEEGAFDFLDRQDMIVAGHSGILLEAALMDVYPLCYDFAKDHYDGYGFIAHGLCERFEEASQLGEKVRHLSAMPQRPSVRRRAAFFCETAGTAYEGQTAELLAQIIIRRLAGQPPAPCWRKTSVNGYVVYKPQIKDDDESSAPS